MKNNIISLREKVGRSSIGLTAIAALLVGAMCFSAPAFAKKSHIKSKNAGKPTVSRDLVFDGSPVNGRYHSAGEATAVVEEEKNLNQLIGARRDFRDRLAAESLRLEKTGKK
jgi:hypothetical protein